MTRYECYQVGNKSTVKKDPSGRFVLWADVKDKFDALSILMNDIPTQSRGMSYADMSTIIDEVLNEEESE